MPTLKINTIQTISSQDWDRFVEEVYGRPYSFQQQDGCRGRRTHRLTVSEPTEDDEPDDFENNTVPEEVNHPEMGVSFKAWLDRDPKKPLSGTGNDSKHSWSLNLWWNRNFYPSIEMVAEDLRKKGLLEEGEYMIIIDW